MRAPTTVADDPSASALASTAEPNGTLARSITAPDEWTTEPGPARANTTSPRAALLSPATGTIAAASSSATTLGGMALAPTTADGRWRRGAAGGDTEAPSERMASRT
ncbi:hypothetical protein [Pandoravirus japonicus]|uniref:Uncharacterized protein n=1 Tax=Pandoravirus japonicus TaxID=2823154 RepID=A0A811BNE6_9VIRU|nr:hypothetical protein [Pandoravirus japonicus]